MSKDFKVKDTGYILSDQGAKPVKVTGVFKSSVLQDDGVSVVDSVSYTLDGSGTKYQGTVYSSPDELIAAISSQIKPSSYKSSEK